MRTKPLLTVIFLIAATITAFGQTTEFTYQGQLQNSSTPATGVFDFEFGLFDTALGGAQIGSTNTRSGVSVAAGIFSVNLDFGQSFPGGNRFLEIRVRQGGGSFTTLSPRQPISSAPYSVKSLNADTAQAAANATNAVNATNATNATTSVSFTGPLAGDVTGTQPATTVARLQGRNVASAQPNNGQVLKYNTTTSQWEPANDETASGSGGGTITGVTAGTGLTGGGASGSVTVAIASSGVGTTQLADGGVTDPKIVSVSGAKVTGAVSNSLQLGGVVAGQYVQTGDPRLSDARPPTAGSGNYIQNQNVGPQATSNFNVSGNGTVGGTLSGNVVSAVTQYNIGGSRVLSIPGTGNLFAGPGAGESNTGVNSSFFGSDAGKLNTGALNAFFGRSSGANNTSGGRNAFFGASSGASNTTAERNSFFGSGAGTNNTTGARNSFFGDNAGGDSTGNDNSFFGHGTGLNNQNGNNNAFFGVAAGISNVGGSNNTIIGANTNVGLFNLSFATAIGSGAVVNSSNTVTLGRALDTVQVPGNLNVAGTLTANINGSSITNLNASNIATGTLAVARGGTGITSSGASGNFLRSNGSAWVSSAIAVADIPVGSGNYIQNQNAGPQASTNFNISGNGTIGGTLDADRYFQNGVRVLNATAVTSVGRNSGGSGLNNTNIGEFAGQTSTINTVSNTYVGARAGQSNDVGNDNSMFGAQTGGNSSGSNNSFFGRSAGLGNSGNSNSFFGINAGDFNTTGSNNTAIGANADMGQTGLTFATAIGAGSSVALSNTIALGRSSGADRVFLWGPLDLGTLVGGGATQLCRTNANQVGDCGSSRRYKTNIQHFSLGLDLIRDLNPVSFDWKDGGMHDLGLVAEDVAAIEPLLVNLNSKGEIEGVKYDRIGVVLVNAVKEQQKQIEDQRSKIGNQQSQIAELKTALCSVKADLALCNTGK